MNIYEEAHSYIRSIKTTKDEEYKTILIKEAIGFMDSLRIDKLLYVEMKAVRLLKAIIKGEM